MESLYTFIADNVQGLFNSLLPNLSNESMPFMYLVLLIWLVACIIVCGVIAAAIDRYINARPAEPREVPKKATLPLTKQLRPRELPMWSSGPYMRQKT